MLGLFSMYGQSIGGVEGTIDMLTARAGGQGWLLGCWEGAQKYEDLQTGGSGLVTGGSGVTAGTLTGLQVNTGAMSAVKTC